MSIHKYEGSIINKKSTDYKTYFMSGLPINEYIFHLHHHYSDQKIGFCINEWEEPEHDNLGGLHNFIVGHSGNTTNLTITHGLLTAYLSSPLTLDRSLWISSVLNRDPFEETVLNETEVLLQRFAPLCHRILENCYGNFNLPSRFQSSTDPKYFEQCFSAYQDIILLCQKTYALLSNRSRHDPRQRNPFKNTDYEDNFSKLHTELSSALQATTTHEVANHLGYLNFQPLLLDVNCGITVSYSNASEELISQWCYGYLLGITLDPLWMTQLHYAYECIINQRNNKQVVQSMFAQIVAILPIYSYAKNYQILDNMLDYNFLKELFDSTDWPILLNMFIEGKILEKNVLIPAIQYWYNLWEVVRQCSIPLSKLNQNDMETTVHINYIDRKAHNYLINLNCQI